MSSIMNSLKLIITDRKMRFYYFNKLGFFKNRSDVWFVERNFELAMGKKIDLLKPETFNEKLQWLNLNDHNPLYTQMVDKYEAKKYVASIIGERHIIPTFGVWDRFEDINFDMLPEQFVLKCTHDSGGLYICRDKSKFDYSSAKKKTNASLKRDYFQVGREWPYKNVRRRIIAEAYMQDGEQRELRDYKFYCFEGEPKFLYLSEGLENHATAHISFVTLDWKFATFGRDDYAPFTSLPEKPKKFDLMIEISKQLSKGIPFLRVDLYEINGEVYFGELTFTPKGATMRFNPPEADYEIGKLLTLPELKR